MQRYFFHTLSGGGFRDLDGTLLPSANAARIEAARVLGQLVSERPDSIWQDEDFRVTVTDEAGLILFTIDVAAAVAPAAQSMRLGPVGRNAR